MIVKDRVEILSVKKKKLRDLFLKRIKRNACSLSNTAIAIFTFPPESFSNLQNSSSR